MVRQKIFRRQYAHFFLINYMHFQRYEKYFNIFNFNKCLRNYTIFKFYHIELLFYENIIKKMFDFLIFYCRLLCFRNKICLYYYWIEFFDFLSIYKSMPFDVKIRRNLHRFNKKLKS
jgi:hypothetical protein